MTPPIPADAVHVTAGAEDAFRRRHRKDAKRADDVWKSLVAKRDALLADVAFGPIFHPPRLPAEFRGLPSLRVIKGLPHGFRAVYSVFQAGELGVMVRIEWIGDHDEYDALFGYSTS